MQETYRACQEQQSDGNYLRLRLSWQVNLALVPNGSGTVSPADSASDHDFAKDAVE